jgi:5'-nucleotidase
MRRGRTTAASLLFILLLTAACGARVEGPAAGPLHILVTNDDGIEAPGIAALAEALLPLGKVTVAAPRDNRSGVSHGVTSDRPIGVVRMTRGGMAWFAIDALPATCLRLALETLLPAKPDLVISGINVGENLGTVTFYSATVAGAREAAFQGIPSMAVHLARSRAMDYATAAGLTADIVRALGGDGVPPGTFLNINIPALPPDRIKGVRIARQDTRAPLEFFEKMVSADGAILYKPSWRHLEPAGVDTDIWALRNGYISVSVFGYDQSAAAAPAAATSLKRLEKLAWK